MQKVQIIPYEGKPIAFDLTGEHRMINATNMGKAFKKEPKDFLRTDQTQAFIEELARSADCPIDNIYYVKKGGRGQGTWMHELLALKFAGWLNPAFEIWMMQRVQELLTTGHSSVGLLPQQQEAQQLVAEAARVAGSQAKLAKRCDVTDGTISFIINGDFKHKIGPDMLSRLIRICERVVKYGMGYDPEIMDMLMTVNDSVLRRKLFTRLKEVGSI